MDRPGGTVHGSMKAWSAPVRPLNVGPLCGLRMPVELLHTLSLAVASEGDETMSQLIFDRIVAAIGANDRAEFLRYATDDMRRAVTPELWEEISQIAPHLNAGYKPTHVRRGEEGGFDVNVWKLSFEDASTDLMLRLVTR